MPSLRLQLLGPFEARGPSELPIFLPTRKSEALLAYACLTPGRPHPRDRLVNLLWSDRGEDQARNSLRHALSALKKVLADLEPAPLVIERNAVETPANAVDVDALSFEDLAGQDEPAALRRAAALYRGEFCEGMVVRDPAGEEWLATTRERYRRMAVEVLERLLVSGHGPGDEDATIETAERLVRLDPLRESAWRALMRAHAARGERNHALKAYKRCCDVLKRELGVEPEPDTTKLHDDIRAGASAIASAERPAPNMTEPATPDAQTSTEVERPSIAVLPFENLSGDPEQEYFSDGITEGIILGLSKFPSLSVKSRHSGFAFKNAHTDVTEIGRLLGVRYVIEGSVRKTPTHVRITVQLVDASNGLQLWGHRYDSEIEGLFALEDELTRAIVATVRGRIDSADQNVAIRRPAKDLRSYDYLMRGIHLVNQNESKFSPQAKEMLYRCIELDPDNARAHAWLAISYVLDWNNRWVEDLRAALQKSAFHSKKAMEISPEETLGHSMLAEQMLFSGEYEKAEYYVRRAAEMNPNDIDTRAATSFVLTALGKIDDALHNADTCVKLDPYHPWLGWHLGITYFTGRRYKDALTALRSVPHPAYEVQGWLAATHMALQNQEEAQDYMRAFLIGARAEMVRFPATMDDMRVYWQDISGYRRPSDFDHLFDMLLAAGLTVDDV
jgi:TolB-like protein/cytochrome c-type biogenesis protein CcmH/NrfG